MGYSTAAIAVLVFISLAGRFVALGSTLVVGRLYWQSLCVAIHFGSSPVSIRFLYRLFSALIVQRAQRNRASSFRLCAIHLWDNSTVNMPGNSDQNYIQKQLCREYEANANLPVANAPQLAGVFKHIGEWIAEKMPKYFDVFWHLLGGHLDFKSTADMTSSEVKSRKSLIPEENIWRNIQYNTIAFPVGDLRSQNMLKFN